MDPKHSSGPDFKRVFLHILSIFAILALAFPVSASASNPNATNQTPHIVASLTWDWFEALEFAPETSLHIEIFDAPGGTLLWEADRVTDASGYVHIGSWEHPVDLVPGVEIEIEDGTNHKELTLEAITLDDIDYVTNILSGTAPPTPGGRDVWVGTGNESTSCADDVTADPVTGAWAVDLSPCDVTEDMWAAAQVFDTDGDVTEANPHPDPFFVIFPEWDWFDGNFWPVGVTVNITVAGKSECTTSGESFRNFFNGSFPEACDIVPGDVVTFSNGVTVRTHLVQNLDVTDLDLLADTVAGTADPGVEVYVWPHATGQELVELAGPSGDWLADFSGIYDIVAGEFGRAAIWDNQGNATEVQWGIPSPFMVIFPEWDWFDGVDWPDGAVNITVAAKPECSLTKVSAGGFFNGSFPAGCDVEIGDTVSFTDGVTVRTHLVQHLDVTGLDPLADTVSGTAAPAAEVHVWPHEGGEEVLAVAGLDGAWLADFSGLFDLIAGSDGRSLIWDAQGNGTAVDWHVPNPHIVATLTRDWFEALEFPPETPVHIQILASPGGALLWEADRTTDAGGYFFVGTTEHPVDLLPGVTLIFDDGTNHKELTLEDVTLEVFDVENDYLAGTAPPPFGRRVWVGTGNDTSGCSADLTSDPITGAWAVDFSLQPCDVTADMWGAAQVFDADGDASEVNPTPSPTMVIFPEWEWFDGNGWPTGATVDITVADKPLCSTSAESERYFFNGGFPEGCDIVFGDVVTFTNGATTRTHTVQVLAVSRVDKYADTVAGTATAGAEIFVWPHDGYEFLQLVVAGPDGIWLADFGGLFDIEPGHAGRSEIRDAQGNSTAVDWYAFHEISLPAVFNP